MEKISRKGFLKVAAAAAMSGVTAGALAACNSAASSSTAATGDAIYTAGTYTGTATGIGEVKVTMTFSADAITDVQIDVANETKGYGADIADEMVKKILDAQSSEVDGHSGATITSGAIKKAAESCINQAKGVAVAPTEANKAETVVPEGLTTEEVESSVCELGDITPDETKDFDVVVVGAGAAGVPAAGWAAEEAEHRGEPGQLRLRHHQVQVHRGWQEDVGAHDQQPVRLALQYRYPERLCRELRRGPDVVPEPRRSDR